MQRGNGIWLALALLWVLPFGVIAQDTLEQVRFDVDRFEVIGDNPIGDSANEILSPYIGEQYGLVRLSAARDALEQAIIDAGFAFHRVSLPPQNLFAGTVQFKISRFLIGKIDVEGNEYFDDENILHSVPQLQVGETPNTRLLSRSLKIANEHPSKSTVLRFREGSEADSIDAQLEVKDRDPQVIFLSLDNTGPDDGEVWRSTLGYQHGNLFNTDQSVTATYTTAPEDTSSTQQFGVFYHIPMYRHGASIDLLFSDSDSSGETGGGDDGGQSISPGVGGGQALEITGEGRVYGVVYNRPLLTARRYNHSVLAGVQHKNFDNTSEFDSVELTGADIISVPLELGYKFGQQAPGRSFFGSITFVQEIGDDDAEYNDDRLEAEAGWNALRYDLTYDMLFADAYLFHSRFSGQYTDALLVSGEQFGLGGEGTLRGFEERSVTGDSGYVLNLELWFPPLGFADVRFLVFIDYGHTKFNAGDIPGNDSVEFDPSSYGAGMYWAWKESLSVSLNYGLINEGGGLDPDINEDGDSKLHFSGVYRF